MLAPQETGRQLSSVKQCTFDQGWQYGTVWYISIFATKYGTFFFVMVRVRYAFFEKVRVRWYAV